MKIAIIQFPGSTCERETYIAVHRAGMEPVPFLWNESPAKLRRLDGYVLVGGFSYGDHVRPGVLAAREPIMKVLKKQGAQGKPILGIGNGAQILVESGLVPGLPNHDVVMALAPNKRVYHDKVMGTGYYNKWVNIKKSEEAHPNAFTMYLNGEDIVRLPVAHGAGRFLMPDTLLEHIRKAGMDVLHYCNRSGRETREFPVNPNGSIDNIAGITNYAGNVLALMPQPERADKGDAIFSSMRDFLEERESLRKGDFPYKPEEMPSVISYVPKKAHQIILEGAMKDIIAQSAESALHRLGIDVTLKRYVHWELECDDETHEAIIKTRLLYNANKLNVVDTYKVNAKKSAAYLVRQREDMLGRHKMQVLNNHFDIYGIHALTFGEIWEITPNKGTLKTAVDKVLASGLLFNPVSQECYHYS